MEQIKKDKLCYYYLGCEAEETEDFRPVVRCKNFEPEEKIGKKRYERS